MKKLVIAEKPSVARDLARVLGKVPKKEDYFENDEWIIDSAVGHLVELFMPDDFDKKLKAWKLSNLPISTISTLVDHSVALLPDCSDLSIVREQNRSSARSVDR